MADIQKKWDTDYEWKAVTLLALGFGMVGLDRWIIASLLPNIGPELGISDADGQQIIGFLGLAWGVFAIFIGRFSGPLRAGVPLVAGIFHMPYWRFQAANFISAFVWVAILLTLGDVVATIFNLIWP